MDSFHEGKRRRSDIIRDIEETVGKLRVLSFRRIENARLMEALSWKNGGMHPAGRVVHEGDQTENKPIRIILLCQITNSNDFNPSCPPL